VDKKSELFAHFLDCSTGTVITTYLHFILH